MPLITQRVLRGLLPAFDPHLTPKLRNRPEKIILGVHPGYRPSEKPPVRIFLGTERQQFRAERVFLWSVEKHRDPSRIYEIYLLKGLQGYNSALWITGFTGYRFAIPHFCDYKGRAIYNDVDQIWLTDPAELFDRDIGNAGFVSINDHDTSVMLMDCQRMADVWNRDSISGQSRKKIEARARAADLWGLLEARYNARDKEYESDSACVHFTTLHTQPWRPFPDQYVYADNPTSDLWPALERQANEARFLAVSSLRPSSAWPDFLLWLSSQHDGQGIRELLGPHRPVHACMQEYTVDDWLKRVPDADLPWVLDRLFASARKLYIQLNEPVWIRSNRMRRSRHFWIEQLRLASTLNPDTRWRLDRRVGWKTETLTGGPDHPGSIVVLSGHSARIRIKAEAVANALSRYTGRELKRSHIHAGPIRLVLQLLFGLNIRTDNAISKAGVIVASGALGTRAAKRIARKSKTPPKLVLIGRRVGSVPEHAGVAISMHHHQLPNHPHRIETLMGFGHQDYFRPTIHSAKWKSWLDSKNKCALLLGDYSRDSWSHAQLEALAEGVMKWSAARASRLLIVTTHRTAQYAERLKACLTDQADLYSWIQENPEQSSNPYALALERSNALMVAGDDAALLGDALTSTAPVYLWPEHQRRKGLRGSLRTIFSRLSARVVRRASKPGLNNRGSTRPQQGLTYICARLIERGWILPPTTLIHWQQAIIDQGLAAWPDDRAVPYNRYEQETESICESICELLELTVDGHDRFERRAPSSLA